MPKPRKRKIQKKAKTKKPRRKKQIVWRALTDEELFDLEPWRKIPRKKK